MIAFPVNASDHPPLAHSDMIHAPLGCRMPNSGDEREDPVDPTAPKIDPTAPKIPEYLVERLAPRSRDPVTVFGGHLLQLIGVVAIIYVIVHFLHKYW